MVRSPVRSHRITVRLLRLPIPSRLSAAACCCLSRNSIPSRERERSPSRSRRRRSAFHPFDAMMADKVRWRRERRFRFCREGDVAPCAAVVWVGEDYACRCFQAMLSSEHEKFSLARPGCGFVWLRGWVQHVSNARQPNHSDLQPPGAAWWTRHNDIRATVEPGNGCRAQGRGGCSRGTSPTTRSKKRNRLPKPYPAQVVFGCRTPEVGTGGGARRNLAQA